MATKKLTKNFVTLIENLKRLSTQAQELGIEASSKILHEELTHEGFSHKKSHPQTHFEVSSQTLEAKKGPESRLPKRKFAQGVVTLETTELNNEDIRRLTEFENKIKKPNDRFPVTTSLASAEGSSKLVVTISSPLFLVDLNKLELNTGSITKKFQRLTKQVMKMIADFNAEIEAAEKKVSEQAYPGVKIRRGGEEAPEPEEIVEEGKIVQIRVATEQQLEEHRRGYKIVPRESDALPDYPRVEIVSGKGAIEVNNPELADKALEAKKSSNAKQTEPPSAVAARAKRLGMTVEELERLSGEIRELREEGKAATSR